MPTRFSTWIDNPVTSGLEENILDYSTFASDTQREFGFKAGESASAVRVNTGLRQANLVIAALMDTIAPTSTVDVASTVSDVKAAIASYFNQFVIGGTYNQQTSILSLTTKGGTSIPINLYIPTIDNAFLLPSSAPSSQLIPSVNTSNNQVNLSISSYLAISNNQLTLSTSTQQSLAKANTSLQAVGTVGSNSVPMYMNNGTLTAMSGTIGSGTRPIFMSSGTLTQSSSGVGASNRIMYMNGGTLTAGMQILSGTSAPASSVGNDGDIYIQYEA